MNLKLMLTAMKNYVKSTIAILFVSSISLTSCFDLAPGASDAEASLKQTAAQSLSMELATSCEFDALKTESIMKQETGIVTRMSNPAEPENDVFLINDPVSQMRYVACNMPEGLKFDGMKVTFDAEKKEVGETEKWYAHPIKLTQIYSAEVNNGGVAGNF